MLERTSQLRLTTRTPNLKDCEFRIVLLFCFLGRGLTLLQIRWSVHCRQ